uniref:Uncharacterized protein n=1 Tax=Romanomermis culicivorax TaxID=13658 RepID=A0A915KZJ6_ROMCU
LIVFYIFELHILWDNFLKFHLRKISKCWSGWSLVTICTMKEIEILKPLEETYPIETTIVPINSLLTSMSPFKIQDFLLKYHFHKE